MAYDNRYPHLEPVERSPLGMGIVDASRARKAVAEICRRTGTRGFYNAITHAVLFVYGDEPHGGPMALPLTDKPITRADIDSAVEYMQLGKVELRRKQAWAEKQEAEEKYQHEQRTQKHLDDVRPDAKSYAAYLDERRRGVRKTTVTL